MKQESPLITSVSRDLVEKTVRMLGGRIKAFESIASITVKTGLQN